MAAWIKSLHLQVAGKQIDIAENYWDFWRTFIEVRNTLGPSDDSAQSTAISIGTDLKTMLQIINRFGVMLHADFAARSNFKEPMNFEKFHSALEQRIAAGALNTQGPLGRYAEDVVFDLLIDCLKVIKGSRLDNDLRRGLAYLKDFRQPGFDKRKLFAGSRVHILENLDDPLLEIMALDPQSDTLTVQPLAYILSNTLAWPWNQQQAGDKDWTLVSYAKLKTVTERADLLRAVQKLLHRRQPIPVVWYTEADLDNATSVISNNYPKSNPSKYGDFHATLITDYSALTPQGTFGFGALKGADGKTELGPKQLDAMLLNAEVLSFKMQNSWQYHQGHLEVTLDYLLGAPQSEPQPQAHLGDKSCGAQTQSQRLSDMVLPVEWRKLAQAKP